MLRSSKVQREWRCVQPRPTALDYIQQLNFKTGKQPTTLTLSPRNRQRCSVILLPATSTKYASPPQQTLRCVTQPLHTGLRRLLIVVGPGYKNHTFEAMNATTTAVFPGCLPQPAHELLPMYSSTNTTAAQNRALTHLLLCLLTRPVSSPASSATHRCC